MRFSRFSLKTLLVFVAACSVPLLWYELERRQYAHEVQVASVLEGSGAEIAFGYDGPQRCKWLLAQSHVFQRVHMIDFDDRKLLSCELERLPELTSLHYLRLFRCQLSSRNLTSIGRCVTIKSLWLNGSDVGDEDLAALATLQNLRELDLSETAVKGDGLRHLAHLPRLYKLDFVASYFSDAAFPQFLAMPQLRELNIFSPRGVSEEALEEFLRKKPPELAVEE